MADQVIVGLDIKNGKPNSILTVEAFPKYIKKDNTYKEGDVLGDYVATGQRMIWTDDKGVEIINGPILTKNIESDNQFSKLKDLKL